MPSAELPTSMTGWLVAVGAGIVGVLAGFLFIAAASRTIN